jgi:hypothetical protein
MTSPSKIARIAALLALSIALTPTGAPASTLLSGYGGPGQGNQAILGAALLNGPSGGGGGGGGSSSTSATNLAAPTTPASTQGSSASPQHAGSGAAGKHGAVRTTGSARAITPHNAEAGAAGAYTVSARGGSVQPLLGLSGNDLLYIVLALGVLAFTGVLTRRLAQRQQASRSGGSRGAAQSPTSN